LLDDPEKIEFFVPVEWADTVPLDRAINDLGLFGNQNTVCAPRTPKWRHTIERLKQAFPHYAHKHTLNQGQADQTDSVAAGS
jgi:hypothetical protein